MFQETGVKKRFCSYHETEVLIKAKEPFILTTQMALLSTDLFYYGYRVFVQNSEIKTVELVLGQPLPTGRELREGYNLFKLWGGGEMEV